MDVDRGSVGQQSPETQVTLARVWLFCLCINCAALVYPILSYRGLFADGAYHLLGIISGWQEGDSDQSRRGALYLLDGPTITLVFGLGLKSIRLASWIYTGTLLLLPWIFLLLSALYLSPQRRVLALFPLLSLLISYFLSSLFAVSEVFIASALWWAVLLYLIGDDLKNRGILLTFICLIQILLMIYSYEPLTTCAFLLLALLIFKYATAGSRGDITDVDIAVKLCLIGCSLFAAFIVGASWTLFPTDPDRGHVFAQGINFWVLLRTYSVKLGVSIFFLGILTFILGSMWSWPSRQRLVWGLWVALVGIFLVVGQLRPTMIPWAQHEARLLIPFSVIFLSGAAVIAANRLERDPSFATTLTAWFTPMLICLSILHTWWQFEGTRGWQRYMAAVTLEKVPGRSVIASHTLEANAFNWPWALASLSIVIDAMENEIVDGVVFVNVKGWRPFDPRCPKSWPSLARLGVEYHADSTQCAGS
jgi:hypothetical protein